MAPQLEKKVIDTLEIARVSPNEVPFILGNLKCLADYEYPSFEHSAKVGILSRQISEYMHLCPKPFVYVGLLHDIGKRDIPLEVLTCKNFGEEEMKIMRAHPLHTFRRLQRDHLYSALGGLFHHTNQKNPYPSIQEMPKIEVPLSDASMTTAKFYSQTIIGIADSYDAAVTRVNNKFGMNRPLTSDEAIELLTKLKPANADLIRSLHNAGILHDQNPLYRQPGPIVTLTNALLGVYKKK